MAAAPASLPVCFSEGTSWIERMDLCKQREDTLPHRGLQINDWGSHVLQAFMHHTQFTCHWALPLGISRDSCTFVLCSLVPITDTSQLKDRDKQNWEWWVEVSLCGFVPGSILVTGWLIGCHSTHGAVQPYPAAVLVISHRRKLNAV